MALSSRDRVPCLAVSGITRGLKQKDSSYLKGLVHDGHLVHILMSVAQASLVASDRLYGAKKQVLDAMGLGSPEEFPVTTAGMPLQLLSYLRLARLQDPAEFAKARMQPRPQCLRSLCVALLCTYIGACHAAQPLWD